MWPTNPRPAKSLLVLREQIDRLFPNRNRASDGILGDESHKAQGNASDHNPWLKDPKGIGVVTAIDITHDPKSCDVRKIFESIVESRDPRLKYLIFNGECVDTRFSWSWQRYQGDPHTTHGHVSVNTTNYDDQRPWNINLEGVDMKPSDAELSAAIMYMLYETPTENALKTVRGFRTLAEVYEALNRTPKRKEINDKLARVNLLEAEKAEVERALRQSWQEIGDLKNTPKDQLEKKLNSIEELLKKLVKE